MKKCHPFKEAFYFYLPALRSSYHSPSQRHPTER